MTKKEIETSKGGKVDSVSVEFGLSLPGCSPVPFRARRTGEFGCPRPSLSASENTGVCTDKKKIFTALHRGFAFAGLT